MSITLTKTAAARVKSQLESSRQPAPAAAVADEAAHTEGEASVPVQGVRLSVKKSGCSGLAYELDYANQVHAAERVFESHGVKIIVENAHLVFLDGTEIDYIEEGLSAAFHFKNPNVTEQCGCGESFTVN